MTPEQAALLERIAPLLDTHAPVREVSMFGSRALMVRGSMLVAVGKDGSLLVRVSEGRGMVLAERPGAAVAVMGTRSMGPGWIRVEAPALDRAEALQFWIGEALSWNAEIAGN